MKNKDIACWTKAWAKGAYFPFVFYKQISSTNALAKEQAFLKPAGPPPFAYYEGAKLFIAESQTKGRGTKGRTWQNSDMMLSWSFLVQKAPQPNTTKIMGHALLKTLQTIWPKVGFQVKAPNDILIDGKKLAGILVEVVSKGQDKHRLIIGVGMNVFSHPLIKGISTTHLSEHIDGIYKNEWACFLNTWLKQIQKSLKPFGWPALENEL